MEVGSRDSDIGALRRNLNQVREIVEEVRELTILNEQRLRRS